MLKNHDENVGGKLIESEVFLKKVRIKNMCVLIFSFMKFLELKRNCLVLVLDWDLNLQIQAL